MKPFLTRLAVLALTFAPAPVLAQYDPNEAPASPPPPEPSTEEERWAAEKEPSQLEPEEKQSSEPVSITADIMLSLRSGYGLAGGKLAAGGSDLSDAIAGQVPIQFDFGALFRSGVYLGGYVQYGFGVLGSSIATACGDAERLYPGTEVSCRAFDIRAGIVLEYHVGAGKKRKAVDPWLGMGMGFESVRWDVAAQDAASAATLTQSASGFEFFSGHFGVDFALADWFALGPYLAFTVGSYGSASLRCEGDCEGVPTGEGDIANTSPHIWAFFGARTLFQFDTSPN